MLDFGDYNPANERLLDAIHTKLLASNLVTPNVDAYRALLVEVRFSYRTTHSRWVLVRYYWGSRMLAKAVHACPRAEVATCSSAIVRGAERASRAVHVF